jgi:hypothetical protein
LRESFGEFSLEWWQSYHSIAQWQAEAPAVIWFWIPAAAWAVGGLVRSRRQRRRVVAQTFPSAGGGDFPVASFPRGAGAEGLGDGEAGKPEHGTGKSREPAGLETGATAAPGGKSKLRRHEIVLRWLAAMLATGAAAETALHLIPPRFPISDKTLALARRFSVQPDERADFETLAARPIWSGQKLQTLLDHVELAGYNRELINWKLDDGLYRDYVLSPVITSEAGEQLNWRRPLWEEFYPRIRHEASPADAAGIVVRHLRERVTVILRPDLPQAIPDILLRQLTDRAGFEIIYVAALRSVGVPARSSGTGEVEIFADGKWQAAPRPVIFDN